MPSNQPTEDLPILTEAQRESSQMQWVDQFSRTLDTKFRLPGTQLRFGVDFILGLIPGIGDFLSLSMSGVLILTMAKNGASVRVVTKMLLNVLLDAVVGTIPILGNIFDLYYKANNRNVELMREYYDEGKHTGSAWPLLTGIFAVLLAVFGIAAWLIYMIASWLWAQW